MTTSETVGQALPDVVAERAVSTHELAVADEIGMAMARLFRLSASSQAKAGSKGGLDRAVFGLLVALVKHGPCRSSTLAELVFVDPSTVSRQVSALVNDGLVERRADSHDGRVSVLAITDSGVELLQRHRDVRNHGIARILAHWAEDDRERFARMFETFTIDYERCLPELLAAHENLHGKQ